MPKIRPRVSRGLQSQLSAEREEIRLNVFESGQLQQPHVGGQCLPRFGTEVLDEVGLDVASAWVIGQISGSTLVHAPLHALQEFPVGSGRVGQRLGRQCRLEYPIIEKPKELFAGALLGLQWT